MSIDRIVKKTKSTSRGDISNDTRQIRIPEKVDVKSIRHQMGLSQSEFARRFGLSLYTLRNWEQGKRHPDPAAKAYLKIIEKAPELALKVLSE
ncbi:MAG: helix-turn-helix domain-containing protein [Treponema sp.]|nr:helix-turn-helix domain-containing protein [Treponema sp.]